jgi:uncharacterized protein (TIGR02001 family)
MERQTMKKLITAAGAALLLTTSASVLAQAKKPEPEFTFTGNAGVFSDYRFRGYSQTGYGPAYQGGFDFAHKSGFYAGNWNSNVEQGLYNGASLEMDFYAGYKGSIGDIGYDVGYLYYLYPNSGALGTTKVSNGELYVGGSYGPLSAKWFYNTTKFFSLGKSPTLGNPEFDTKGSWYLDLTGNFDLGNGLTLTAHYGYQKVKNARTAFQQGLVFADEDKLADYKVGITYDLSGWILGAAYIGTSEKGFFRTAESGFTEASGKGRPVLSVTKSF